MANIIDLIAGQPFVYNAIQRLGGLDQTLRKLRPHFEGTENCSVLDLGAGTGNFRQIMPASIQYLWLDNDPLKLRGFRRRHDPGMSVLGDVTRIPLRDGSVDIVFCCAVSHHLAEEQIQMLFREMARTCRRKVIFLDAVWTPESTVSRLLWRYDRGSFPRSGDRLRELMAQSFDLIHNETYTIYHQYVLFAGTPKHANARGPEKFPKL